VAVQIRLESLTYKCSAAELGETMHGCQLRLTITVLVCAYACAPVQAQEPVARRAQGRGGVVYLVGGIGGFDSMGCCARVMFPAAGIHHELRDFIWTHGKGSFLKDLQDTRHLVHKADELAAQIREQHTREPQRPIFLVAKSGGTGLALLAAEQLPPSTLERMVLISAAVTPEYDLRPALRATRREVVAFSSKNDQVILNWGTRQFGTVDRFYGPGAGYRGFVMPKTLDAEDLELYKRLVQVHWKPTMLIYGYAGTHTGTSSPGFLLGEVAPWLKR
jgi:pimeloyl-ACP methyl ester carboxylesterase